MLSDRDRQILAFERAWWRQPGAKEQAIRDTFGLSITHYFALLNRLLDDPAAEELEPAVVRRLRQVRDARLRVRLGGKS